MRMPRLSILLVAAVISSRASGQLRNANRLRAAAGLRKSATGPWFSLMQVSEDPDGCTCDCCLSTRLTTAAAGASDNSGDSTLGCAPRSGASNTVGDGDCLSVCTALPEVSAALQSTSGQVDYSTYCPQYCRNINEDVNVVCVSHEVASQVWDEMDAAAEAADEALARSTDAASSAANAASNADAASPAAPSSPSPAPASMPAMVLPPIKPEELGFEPALSDLLTQGTAQEGSQVRIAKALTAKSREQAVLAGKAARRARLAYEAVLSASQDAAESAGKMALENLQTEARLQATQAAAAREEFEARSKSEALEAAAHAAGVYQNASQRDAQIAGVWEAYSETLKQSGKKSNFAKGQEQHNAAVEQQQGKDGWRWRALRAQGKARRAEAEGVEFQRRAREADAQAAGIRKKEPWYDHAEQEAGKRALQEALPAGVQAPHLPLPAEKE